MKLPFREIHGLSDCQRNFEAIEALGVYVRKGAPAFTPSEGYGFYFRTDTPTVANQRVYVWNPAGPAWIGVV